MSERKPWSACWCGIHAWTRWGESYEVPMIRIVRLAGVQIGEGTEFVQHRQDRECVNCGRAETRKVAS